MFHQTIARNQRPKGIKVMGAFQFTLLLGIFIWLLYQMKHSNDNRKDYGAALQNNYKEHRSIRLGGKGKGWSTHGAEMEEDGTEIEKGRKELDGGGGDDELDRDMEEEAIRKGYEALKDLSNQEVKDKGKVSGTQQKESQNDEDVRKRNESGSFGNYEKAYKKIAEQSIRNHEKKENVEKKLERQTELQTKEKYDTDTKVRYGNEDAQLEKEKDSNTQETTISPTETKTSARITKVDKGTGIDGFHDENGIPEDGHELINSLINKTKGDDPTIRMHQETVMVS